MRLEQLYYIVEIADTGSFTASSERLFVSQPSISQSVNALEKELDVAIFKRSRSGAIPTEAGKLIIEHARAILNEINEIKSLSVQNDAELKGFLNVAAVPSMCYQILPCSIARFSSSRMFARVVTNWDPAGVSAAPLPLRANIANPTSSSSSRIWVFHASSLLRIASRSVTSARYRRIS